MRALERGSAMLLWALGFLALSVALPPTATAAPPTGAQVVVLGVGGLRWTDLSAAATPNLWRLAGQSAVAAVSARTAKVDSCPSDAWLTLNTGVRMAAPRRADGVCPDPGELMPSRGSTNVSRWSEIANSSYDPEPGLLAAGAAHRGCATAVGPGAGLALADARGHVARYAARLDTADLHVCPLTVVDLGSLPQGRSRGEALRAMDAAIGTVNRAVPNAELVVVGMGNESTPHLQTLLMHGGADQGWIDANSTRHRGLAQLTDVTPTVLARLGVAVPDRAVGSVLRTTPGAPRDPQTLVDELSQFDRAAQTIDQNIVGFYLLVVAGALIASALLIAFRRPQWPLLVVASLPVASFLANLLQWWRFSWAAAGLWVGAIGWAVAIGTLARFGPWRRQRFGSAGFVAAVTAVVLVADVATGSRLQLSSLWGLSPLDAGRFYGFGNVAFALFAMSALIAGTWIATLLIRQGRRRWAAAVVVGIGAVSVAVDGWPSFGADFGGVLALVPGFAVLVAAVAQVRLRLRWVLITGATAIVAVVGVALVDWSRPAGSRTHLGRFVQQVLDGGAGSTVQRKLDANVQSFTDRPWLAMLVVVVVVFTAVLVIRPQRLPRLRAATTFAEEPLLRACIAACLVTAVVGLVVNDSGAIVLGVCCAAAVPLLVHAWHSVTSDREPRRQPLT
ncbi:hypothetical protein [Kribbella sp. NPDC004875]|uniref:hypothetical protein n=1 Tax=Kribbella sp. NPDC004875 TaxID=3364107 RepID=UPI0036B8EF0A